MVDDHWWCQDDDDDDDDNDDKRLGHLLLGNDLLCHLHVACVRVCVSPLGYNTYDHHYFHMSQWVH